MKPPGHAVAVLLLAAGVVGCKPAGPLDGLSEKEMRAAKAQANSICLMAGKANPSAAEIAVGLGDMAIGHDQGDPMRITEAANALARKRGCVAK